MLNIQVAIEPYKKNFWDSVVYSFFALVKLKTKEN